MWPLFLGFRPFCVIDFSKFYQSKCQKPRNKRPDELLWMLWFHEKVYLIRHYNTILTIINEPKHWWIVTWLGNRRLTVLNFFPFKTIWSIMTSIVGWGWHMALIPIMAHACLAVQFSSGNWKQFTTKNISKLK